MIRSILSRHMKCHLHIIPAHFVGIPVRHSSSKGTCEAMQLHFSTPLTRPDPLTEALPYGLLEL